MTPSTTRDRNRQRLDLALDLLGAALLPVFKREAARRYGPRWMDRVEGILRNGPPPRTTVLEDKGVPDLPNLLYVLRDRDVWRNLFGGDDIRGVQVLIAEVQQVRNRAAHIHHYSNADTYRDLDSITRVLEAFAPADAARTALLRQEALLDLCQEEYEKLANKKAEVLAFLTNRVFHPLIASSAPADVKRRVRETMETLQAMETAQEIIEFYWTAIINSTDLPKRMKQAGVVRFEEVMEEFRARFNDQWLTSD